MTWMKIDDRLHSHRKPRAAGLAAMGLWVLTGSWVADQLTDGFVPAWQPYAWAGTDADPLAQRLVDAGLWLPTTDDEAGVGWTFHDWRDFQPTRADVLARRTIEREKKRRQRSMRPEGTPGGSPPGSPGTGNSLGDIPYPDSRRDTSTHTYITSSVGSCADCGLPEKNARHR